MTFSLFSVEFVNSPWSLRHGRWALQFYRYPVKLAPVVSHLLLSLLSVRFRLHLSKLVSLVCNNLQNNNYFYKKREKY